MEEIKKGRKVKNKDGKVRNKDGKVRNKGGKVKNKGGNVFDREEPPWVINIPLMWGATEQNIERLVVATLLIKYWLRGGGGFKLILRPTPILSNYTYYIKCVPVRWLVSPYLLV